MKLRILDKYVLRELLYPFIFGIASFSSIFIASTMLFKLTQYLTQYGASIYTVGKMFAYSMPEVINYTFPMSMLLASLMAFGKLSGSSEIVAMKSGGISFYRIVAPVIVVGFIVSMFSLVWAEKVVPVCKARAAYILDVDIKHNTKPTTQEHIIIKTFKGAHQTITYAKSFEEKKGLMQGITIEEFDQGRVVRVQTAKTGTWANGSWTLHDGKIFQLDAEEGVQSAAAFKEQYIPLDLHPRQISWAQKEPEEMTIAELKESIRVLEKQKVSTANQWVEMFMRMNIPLASLFFALIGACLGTQKQRTSSSIGLGISVLVIFIYYAIMTLTTGLGRGNVIPPLLACCIPNMISAVIGIYLAKKKNV